MSLRCFSVVVALLALLPPPGAGAQPAPLPDASWDRLPEWRGFNLLNRFHRDWANRPFEEAEFQLLARLGFNFVRLPIDYRTLIVGTNWTEFSNTALEALDRAVLYGERHAIHVCLNFHRIPGFTVASPPEPVNLFTDPEAQRVAALHWSTLARRYAGRPNSQVSFNLFNEPHGVSAMVYSNVVARLVTAIRAEDPERLIIADGLEYGRQPVLELIPLRVAQATRGYAPFGLTHYRASWVSGSEAWPVPVWPASRVNHHLYGSMKQEYQSPLVLAGPFPVATRLRIHVSQVSSRARLVVRAGNAVLLDKLFVPGPGEGEWAEVVHRPEWNSYQNFYRRDYTAVIPAGSTRVTLANTDGDWLTFREVGLLPERPGAVEVVLRPGAMDWGERQIGTVEYRDGDMVEPFRYPDALGRDWLWRETIQPWVDLRDRGVGVMVGEWGVHNQTPHPVALAWMRDMLANYRRAGLGWALWNFGGSFGPLDSDRRDVAYEPLEGRRADRAMLELLLEK